MHRIKAIHSALLPTPMNAICPLLTKTQSLQNEYQKLEEQIKNLNVTTKYEEEKMTETNEKEDFF